MKQDKKNEFDRQLADKFANFRPEVPGGLWGKIASKLDEQQHGSIVPIKQQRRFPTRWLSVAASVLIVCGIVYWYNRPVAVTYLQSPVVHMEEMEAPVVEEPAPAPIPAVEPLRSEEHTSELQSLMRISYAVFRVKKKNNQQE